MTMQSLNKKFIYGLILFGLAVSSVSAQTSTAVIYGSPFYPSDYTPEMMVYARDVETGRTYSVKVAEEVYEYKMILPAPATYIFFSWTTHKTDPEGAVLSKCDGSSVAICDHDDFAKHFPRPITLKSGQLISNLEVSNYYYPRDKTYMFVPKP